MILFFGDVHGNFEHVTQLVKNYRPAAIILLGDIEAHQSLEKELERVLSLTEVFWIHGNHDTDSIENYNNLFSSTLVDRNLHGRVVEIDGVKVAGLGGVFRESSWYPRDDLNVDPLHDNYDKLIKAHYDKKRVIRNIESDKDSIAYGMQYKKKSYDLSRQDLANKTLAGNELKHKSTIFYDDWLKLSTQRADILVTHEAPSCHPYGFIGIDALARALRVKSSFHGHMHDRLDYSDQFKKLSFNAYGVGFCGVSDQEGNLISPGDFDEHFNRLHLINKRSRDK